MQLERSQHVRLQRNIFRFSCCLSNVKSYIYAFDGIFATHFSGCVWCARIQVASTGKSAVSRYVRAIKHNEKADKHPQAA